MATKILSIGQVPYAMVQAFLKKVAVKGIKKNHWTPRESEAGEVEAISNDSFGRSEIKLFCEADKLGNPTSIMYSGLVRENGAIDEVTSFGTPSVFFALVKFDKKGHVMLGMIDEFRPVMRYRFLVRPNDKYLDLQGNLIKFEEEVGDIFIDLPEGSTDHQGESVNRILYRYGVTVFGVPGGYGDMGLKLNDLEMAATEVREESGVIGIPEIVMQASMDRAWAPVMDIHGFVIVRDESQIGEAELGAHEEIDAEKGITWVYPDEADFRLSTDKHVVTALFATMFHFGLFTREPQERPWNKDSKWWDEEEK